MLQPKGVSKRAGNEAGILAFAAGATRSGIAVTPSTALASAAVWACVRVLSESVAQLPLPLYKRTATGKVRAVDHPVYRLLHDMPNAEMTAFQLRRLMMVHIATWGTAFCEIEWGNDGYPVALWPLSPSATEPVRLSDGLYFDTRLPNGKVLRLPSYRVWSVTGLGTDPLVGISPIRQHMETIGLAQAMTAHGSKFFSNGARPGIILKHPGTLNDDALKRLKESITLAYEGLDNAHRTMILEEGMGVEKIGIPPDEAQFLGSREFQTVEIARIYNVPPHMIQHLKEATYSNIEHQGLQFVTNTLMPYLVNFEQTVGRDLLVENERDEFYAEHLVDSLQRGDIQTRYNAYSTGIQTGFMSINEARNRENLDAIEGGDVHLVPLNLAPLGTTSAPKASQNALTRSNGACSCGKAHESRSETIVDAPSGEKRSDADENQRKRRVELARGFVPVFEDVYGRAVRRESKAVVKAANKYLGNRTAQEFDQWLTDFYEEFLPTLTRDLTPAMLSVAKQAALTVVDELGGDDLPVDQEARLFVEEFLKASGISYINASKARIRQVYQDAVDADTDPIAAIETETTDWETARAGQSADLTAFEALNALVVFNYGRKGIRRLMWQASGSSCKFCQSLSGATIAIERFFVEEGSTIDLGVDGSLSIDRNKRHAPLHRGCDCQVKAVVELD